ncbi:hypothetical protein ACYEXS_34645, partial [Paenibacillus sp. MAH-36]
MLNLEARKRSIWLIIVLCFALVWPITKSTYLLFHPSHGVEVSNLRFGLNVIFEVLGLILLGVSLKIQKRSFKEFGLTFKFSDLGHALLLYFSFYILEIILFLFVPDLKSEPHNVEFYKSNIT